MKKFNANSCENTVPLGKVAFFAVGLLGLSEFLAAPAIPADISIQRISHYIYNGSKINIPADNTGGAILPKSGSDFTFYNDIRSFSVLFIKNIKDIPPEFNKTFRKNFRRLLA